MATMLVRHRVANFDNWKRVFDRLEPTREANGFTGHSVHRDATDPNIVVIVNHVKTMEDAKRYGASQAMRDAMKEAGVESVPEVTFLTDVEEARVS